MFLNKRTALSWKSVDFLELLSKNEKIMYVYKFSLMKQINDTDITCQTLCNMYGVSWRKITKNFDQNERNFKYFNVWRRRRRRSTIISKVIIAKKFYLKHYLIVNLFVTINKNLHFIKKELIIT